jgi:hypothetical protein
MMVDDAFTAKGVFVPEQLEADARQYCFRNLADLGVTIDKTVQQKSVYACTRRKKDAARWPNTADQTANRTRRLSVP